MNQKLLYIPVSEEKKKKYPLEPPLFVFPLKEQTVDLSSEVGNRPPLFNSPNNPIKA